MSDFLEEAGRFLTKAIEVVAGILVVLYILAFILHGSMDKAPTVDDGQQYAVTLYSGGEVAHRWRDVIGYRCLDSYTRLYFEDGYLDIVDGPVVIEREVSHASGGTRAELA